MNTQIKPTNEVNKTINEIMISLRETMHGISEVAFSVEDQLSGAGIKLTMAVRELANHGGSLADKLEDILIKDGIYNPNRLLEHESPVVVEIDTEPTPDER